MDKAAPKKKVGRPKKSPTIPIGNFKGIGTAENPIKPAHHGAIEWTYTEVKSFNNIMKTFKSCEVETMKISFLRTQIIIEGVTNKYRGDRDDRKTRVTIDASDTFSYYIRSPVRFTVNMSEWSTPLEDMDESCNEFTIIYRSGDYFNIQTVNATIGCVVCNTIKIEKSDTDFPTDNIINSVIQDYKAKIINIKASNLKSFLGKNSRKSAQESTFQVDKDTCSFGYKLTTERPQNVTFKAYSESKSAILLKNANKTGSKTKEQFYVISRTDLLYDIKFPTIEIHKFLLHIKDNILEIYFGEDAIVVRVIKPKVVIAENLSDSEIAALPPHSVFIYYIPLSNSSS